MSSPYEVKPTVSDGPQEVQINVPWGYIAGKWWGPKHIRPILCLHGWQDNAGTFDRIIPLLPKHVGYLAIDFPGHGLSSHLPHGIFYSNSEFIPLLKHIKKMYNWDKLSILAHSMGSLVTYEYAAFYPDDIDMYIAIDTLKLVVLETHQHVHSLPDHIHAFLLADEHNRSNTEPPSYTYETCVSKLLGGIFSTSIDHKSAPYLLNRSLAQSKIHPDRYYFTRDNRLKAMMFPPVTQEINMELAKRIKCAHQHIRAKDSFIIGKLEDYYEVIECLQKNNPIFEYHVVEGTHHVHLTNPDVVKDVMSDFINKFRPATVEASYTASKL